MKLTRTDGFEPYKTPRGWRWREWAKGRKVANSGQAYSRRIDAENAFVGIIMRHGGVVHFLEWYGENAETIRNGILRSELKPKKGWK